MFGDLDYDPSMDYASAPLEEQLEAIQRAVRTLAAGMVTCRVAGVLACK